MCSLSKFGSGRKTDDNKLNAFLQLCNWLDQECDLELYSVGELHRVMETIAGTSDVYHKRYLKQKLIDHYKGQLFFGEVNGKNDVRLVRLYVNSLSRFPQRNSKISFLPIINLKPTDLSCIYSSLKFIVEQLNSIGMETAVVTFDQPLWLKATEIVRSKDLPIVLILGGFHTMISYMGSIGVIMKGSGIHESLETIYGSNAADHILSGKAVSRAVRAHFRTEAVLKKLLLEEKYRFLSKKTETK